MRNLLSNALKFSHESGFIFVEPHGDSGFKVRDNGVGMAPDMVEQLLDSNTFAPGKGTSGEKGMGIGMQIVNTMCKKIGGILRITSYNVCYTKLLRFRPRFLFPAQKYWNQAVVPPYRVPSPPRYRAL